MAKGKDLYMTSYYRSHMRDIKELKYVMENKFHANIPSFPSLPYHRSLIFSKALSHVLKSYTDWARKINLTLFGLCVL